MSRLLKFPSGHKLRARDSKRITCQTCNAKPAAFCEYSRWALPTRTATKGISFFYYCPGCWVLPGPSGSTPEQRAQTAVAS